MKIIERLRELHKLSSGPFDKDKDPWMDKRCDAVSKCLNALPALLAVVEAEAAEELKVWTVPGDGIRETELASDSFANAALDGLLDAIRALNGETT